jgi:hypothetical protein
MIGRARRSATHHAPNSLRLGKVVAFDPDRHVLRQRYLKHFINRLTVGLGLRSHTDWSIVRRAVADGYVLVTNNTTDFMSLLRRETVHAGLVSLIVAPGLMRLDVQKRLFILALDRLGM